MPIHETLQNASIEGTGRGRGVRRRRSARRVMAALALIVTGGASALMPAGCNIVVPAAYILEGPPKVDAKFTLPADKRTVVFVDDTRNHLPRTALRTRIGDKAVTLLLEQAVVTDAVASADAMQVARRFDTESKRLAIAQIGEEVGAETMIYVKIETFHLSPDGVTPRPVAEVTVKVLDIAASKRIFPEQGEHGAKVMAQLREQSLEAYKSSAGRRDMEDALADEIGREVAGLFYAHEKRELGERTGVR